MLRLRAYNALLQGQFRDSEVEFDRSSLETFVGEIWAGATKEFRNRSRFGVFVRMRTAELSKVVARRPVWAGFLISKSY